MGGRKIPETDEGPGELETLLLTAFFKDFLPKH
jgi:hypothetical protein